MTEAPLTGWKEIAGFLGSSVRTVQRLEREFGLPVRRVRAARGAVVRAYPSELRGWLEGRSPQSLLETLSGVPLVQGRRDRVVLTIRPPVGSPFQVAGPNGGRLDLTLGRELDLTLQPIIHGRTVILDLGLRSANAADVQPLRVLQLVARRAERVNLHGLDVEFLWNGGDAPSLP